MAASRSLVLLLLSCGQQPPDPGLCPPGGTDATWQNHGRPFVETWCTGCHSSVLAHELRQGSPPGVDFDTFQGVEQHAERIYERAVVQASMPAAGGPSDEGRSLLGEWIACGLPGGKADPPLPCSGERRYHAGDLVVDSPADLDTFCASADAVAGTLRFQGAGHYALDCLCAVDGDVVVAGPAGSVDLPNLGSIGGSLDLTAVSGLTSFTTGALLGVAGDVRVEGVPLLVTIAIDRVEDVGGSLLVEGNPSLAEAWLDRLFTVGGDLRLVGNPQVTATSLDRLVSVGGDLVVDDNPLLDRIYGDAYVLQTVGGDLVLAHNDALYGFYGFEELVSVGGDLDLIDNDAWGTFHGFTRLETIGGRLRIADHERLAGVDGFDFLVTVGGSLEIEDNPGLRFDTGFRVLDRVVGELVLSDLPLHQNMTGMDDLREVGALRIERTGLTNLASLVALDVVDGDFTVVDNAALPSGDVDALVASIGEIGGTVTNSGNAP